MKKAANSTPNQLLKVERELRGWSQKYVADRIGADHYYLSRWEHGTASPSPYYRQKLCTLFGKNAKDLGLLRAALDEQGQPATARHEHPADSAGALLDPAIPRSPWQPPVSLGAERCFSNSENDYVQAKTSH